ncbi:MAG: hypothetical protein D6762_00540 [Candidatus Neomarinimicrobiota bacterium]|nr:MAG: hypothetical protein D6762_00540 [Candidatus Neomarinimicrobiota bacterium]
MTEGKVVGLLCLVSATCLFSQHPGPRAAVHWKRSDTQLTVEVNLDTVWLTPDQQLRCRPRLPSLLPRTRPALPCVREAFPRLTSSTRLHVFPGPVHRIPWNRSTGVRSEVAKGLNLTRTSDRVSPPSKWATWQPAVNTDGYVLEVHPIRFTARGWEWTPTLTVILTQPAHDSTAFLSLSRQRLSSLWPHAAGSRQVETQIPAVQFASPLVRIDIDSEGWFEIPAESLADSGFALTAIDPATFQLWEQNREVPLWVECATPGEFQAGDRILFHGRLPRPPVYATYRHPFYTSTNHYWLTWGGAPGIRYATESGYPNLPPDQVLEEDSFLDTLHWEQDDVFARLGSRHLHQEWDRFDHFFIDPPIQGGTAVDFTLPVPAPSPSSTHPVSVQAEFQGITSVTHDLQLTLNHVILGSDRWIGQETLLFSTDARPPLTGDLLVPGDNILTVYLAGSSPNNRYDQVYLNWVDICYYHQFQTENNTLRFRRNSTLALTNQFTISGLTSPEVYLFKEGQSRITDFQLLPDGNTFQIRFQDFTGSERPVYTLFTSDQIRPVLHLQPVDPLQPPAQGVHSSYLILAPDSFRTVLEPLAAFHQAQILSPNDIYRAYSGGVIDPHALKTFFREVAARGSPPLRYVLLAQQGRWFGWEHPSGPDRGFIPAMKMQTYGFGAVASDAWYTLLDEDLIPDFAIGRFPAATREDLEAMVAKTLADLDGPLTSAHNRLLMIGGYEHTFKEQTEALIPAIVDRGYFPRRLYIDRYSEGGPFFGNTDTLIQSVNRGLWYINFLGHGGGAVWGDRSLLTLDDIDGFHNSVYPFVTSMTCFTGDVTNPDALGRRLMERSGSGVAAWFGSAGVGWIINDYLLLEPLHHHLFSAESWTLGELINQAKVENLATNTGFPTLAITQLYQFNLTGDPALPIRSPGTGTLTPHPVEAEPGTEIILTGFPPGSDSLDIHLLDQNYLPRAEVRGPSLTIPDDTPAGVLTLPVLWRTGDVWGHTAAYVGCQGALIRVTGVSPAALTETDSLTVQLEGRDPAGIDSVGVRINGIRYRARAEGAPGYYATTHPPFPAGATVYLEPFLRNLNGRLTWGPSRTLTVSPGIAPRLEEIRLLSQGTIGLDVFLSNPNTGIGTVQVALSRFTGSAWPELGRQSATVHGVQTTCVRFELPLEPTDTLFRALLEPGATFAADTLEAVLHPTAFWVTPGLGTTGNLTTHQSVGLGDYRISIDPGCVSAPEILRVSLLPPDSLPATPGLRWSADTSARAFRWSMASPSPVTIPVYPHYPGAPFIYSLSHAVWQRIDLQAAKSWTGSGLLGWFNPEDQTPPRLEVNINGQAVLHHQYLSSHPRFTLQAQDDRGMDFRPEALHLWLNGRDLLPELPVMITGRGAHAVYQFTPALTETDSLLRCSVQDAAGNRSDTLAISFIVRSQLDLLDYGNYPNPFRSTTRFVYELTDNVDRFQLDIYTVSGHPVKHFDAHTTVTGLDPRTGAYHEIVWDGTDADGAFVANGVYFYRYLVKRGNRTVIRQGKVAKIR